MSANSLFYDGRNTGYASYWSQLWMRWPSAGPTDTFGTPDAYHQLVRSIVESGVLVDGGMIYFDARLSRRYSTVEIRVADMCVDLEDALVVAALCRALVDPAAAEAARGYPVPQMPTSLLRLAVWRAGHDGVGGVLVDPVSGRPRPWAEVGAAQSVVRRRSRDQDEDDREPASTRRGPRPTSPGACTVSLSSNVLQCSTLATCSGTPTGPIAGTTSLRSTV